MKEMAKMKWQVVSETYCPGAPTTEQVWMQKNPEIVEKYTNVYSYHDDHQHQQNPLSSGYRSGSSTKSFARHNPHHPERGASEDWIKTKHTEVVGGAGGGRLSSSQNHHHQNNGNPLENENPFQ